MKSGLCFGKYFPFHKGHEFYLIEASKLVDELNIVVCANKSQVFHNITPKDRYLAVLRFVELKDLTNVKVHLFNDLHLPQSANSKEESLEVSKIWAQELKSMFPQTDAVITSEEYGIEVAEFMGVHHFSIDVNRSVVPISATAIRSSTVKNWKFVNEYIQSKLALKVCIYGPESCGKTTLAKKLSRHFSGQFVPEHARMILSDMNLSTETFEDIALGQYAISQVNASESYIQFCDTDLMITQEYAKHYLGEIPELVNKLQAKEHYDFYILLAPSVKWVDDGLRDISQDQDRWNMFYKLKQRLIENGTPYIEVNSSSYEARYLEAVKSVELLIQNTFT